MKSCSYGIIVKSCSYVAREAKGRANFSLIVAIASKLASVLYGHD